MSEALYRLHRAQYNEISFSDNNRKQFTDKISNFAHYLFKELVFDNLLTHSGRQFLCMIRWMVVTQPRSQFETINRLSGSAHLSKALKVFSEALANQVQSSLAMSEGNGIMYQFLSNEQQTFKQIFDSLLPTIYVNIARNIQEECKNLDELIGKKVGLADLVGYFSKIINEHLPRIHSSILLIDQIQDPFRKEKKIKRLFRPIVDEILLYSFPNGLKEFPILYIPNFSKKIWSWIQIELTNQCYILYKQFMSPFQNTKKDLLLQMQGGESLVLLAETISSAIEEKIPGLFLKEPSGEYSSAVAGILKDFRRMINGSEVLKNWLCGWLGEQCDQLGKTQDPNITLIWKLLAKYAEPFFIHIFYHLSEVEVYKDKIEGKKPDVLSVCYIKLFTFFSNFFNAHGNVIAERTALVKRKNKNPEKDEILLTQFKNLTSDFLRLLCLHTPEQIPVPDIVKSIVFDGINDFLPRFFLKQHLLTTTLSLSNEDIGNALRKQFFDQVYLKDPLLAMTVLSHLYAKEGTDPRSFLDLFHRELWRESGTEKIVQLIEGLCSSFSYNAVAGFMETFSISSQRLLKKENNPFMKEANQYIKSFVERMMLNFLKNLFNSTKEKIECKEGDHPKKWLLFNIFFRVVDTFQNGLKKIDEEIENISKTDLKGTQSYNQKMRHKFLHLASFLHELFGKEGINHLRLDGLPNYESMRQALWDTLKETLFADQLFSFYSETCNWQQQYQESLKALEFYYQTTHPIWACHVFAQYASDYLKNFLIHSNQDAGKLLFNAVLSYFGNSLDNSNQEISKLLLEQEPAIIDLFSHNLRAIGEFDDPVIQQFWGALAFYIETALAKFLAALSKSIYEVEQTNPNLMIDMAIALLKETADHFNLINRATENLGEERIPTLDLKTILSGFGFNLNDGMPLDPKEQLNEKDAIRLEGFFYPLALKLFNLAQIVQDELPIPSLFRNKLGSLMMQETIPLALLKASQEALKSSVRDELMLNFVQSLYAELNRIELKSSSKMPVEINLNIDPKQKYLNETCGELVLELVKLIPDNMVQYVLMKEQVKKMSAEMIGENMMPFLSKWTFLQVIDALVFKGLPNFHPSRWEGKLGKESLVPRKAVVRPDGKIELKVAKKFKFTFPKNEEKPDLELQMKNSQASSVRKLLRNEFTTTISLQLWLKAISMIKEIWTAIQRALDDFIERQFLQNGVQIKETLDIVCRKVFIELLGSVIGYILWPLMQLIGFIIKKLYIDVRSDDIIENLHAETLENLFYRSIDTIVDMLLALQTQKAKQV